MTNFGETSPVLAHFGKFDLVVFEKEWNQNKVQGGEEILVVPMVMPS